MAHGQHTSCIHTYTHTRARARARTHTHHQQWNIRATVGRRLVKWPQKKSVWITWGQDLIAWFTSGSAEYHFSSRYFLRNGTYYWSGDCGCEIIGNPPESIDPAPSDFHRCGPLNKKEPGMRFVTDVDVKQTATSYLLTFETDFFDAGIQALLPRWDNSRTVNVDLVLSLICTICYPSSIYGISNTE
jgi:hypothetical protein